MKKEIGSKLASSVRQAKSNRSQETGADASLTKVSPATTATDIVIQMQVAPSFLSSKRVWPD